MIWLLAAVTALLWLGGMAVTRHAIWPSDESPWHDRVVIAAWPVFILAALAHEIYEISRDQIKAGFSK
jgi:hypothetical protein